ncbi:hypothetical protein BCR44DRAFT_1440372 [Catenaria anguillulae PL171]|uniref:Uncharacterized protein n=1 Tax=Catenaria anguillulae PL171 TaxID=765915 RepID=A0A1Y2HCQ1_9FUNG|nr:hypothetical protein BCR44DRAFT_1440372 [Catenaria anguillulae PL171]
MEHLQHVALNVESVLVRDVSLSLSASSSSAYASRPSGPGVGAPQFVIDFSPPSHAHLVFPWDPRGAAMGDYDVLSPLLVIKARLAQGFHIQSVTYQPPANAPGPAVGVGGAKADKNVGTGRGGAGGSAASAAGSSGSAGRISYRIIVLAYNEFTLDLIKQTGGATGRSGGAVGAGTASVSGVATPASSAGGAGGGGNAAAVAAAVAKIGSNAANVGPRGDVAAFNDFLKALVDQDLVHKVVTEVAVKVARGGGGSTAQQAAAVGSGSSSAAASSSRENFGTYVQLVESLLKTHASAWMDEHHVHVAAAEHEVAYELKKWANMEVGGGAWFVRLIPVSVYATSSSNGGGAALGFKSGDQQQQPHQDTAAMHSVFTNGGGLPGIMTGPLQFHGTISLVAGPNLYLNQSLLKHRQYVYTVSPELLTRMTQLTIQHHTGQGYVVVHASADMVVLAKGALQCFVSFKDQQQLVIDNFQMPGDADIAVAESRDLTEKLSAMYTIDCLLRSTVPEDDPLFSLTHVLTHSKMTIMGTTLAIHVPVLSFSRTYKRHLAASCAALECQFDHENVHLAIHEHHGFAAPITNFDCLVYVASTVLIFFVPRDTKVPYTIVYECLVDKMIYYMWDTVPLIPHTRARAGQAVQSALVSTFYYTGYHVQTQDIEAILNQCAWPALVECVYSLSHQLHPRDVSMCIEALHEVSASVDVTRLMLVFDLLRQAQPATSQSAAGASGKVPLSSSTSSLLTGSTRALDSMGSTGSMMDAAKLIEDTVTRFDRELNKMMRVIPDSTYFNLVQPYYFCALAFMQPDCVPRRVTSLPTAPSPPFNSLADVSSKLSIQQQHQLVLPFNLELHFCYFSLERDAPALTSIIDAHTAELQAFIRSTIARLLLRLSPVTVERLRLVLSDLGVLPRHVLPLTLLKPAPIDMVLKELQNAQSMYGRYHGVRLDNLFYLVPKRDGGKCADGFLDEVVGASGKPSFLVGGGGGNSGGASASKASSILDVDVSDLEGLGISLPSTTMPMGKDLGSQSPLSQVPSAEISPTVGQDEQEPFEPMDEWIIFTAESGSIVLYTANQDVVQQFQEVAVAIAHRVNTRMLLSELRDTHTASKYLIMPDSPEPREPTARDSSPVSGTSMSMGVPTTASSTSLAAAAAAAASAGGNVRKGRMAIGQFACPVQFSYSFPLHWRLKPQVALNSVAASLNSLAPRRPSDDVYYMHLSETSVGSSGGCGTGGEGSIRGGGGGGGSASMSVSMSVSMNPLPDASATSPSTPNVSHRKLVLNLHGLVPPTRDFTNEVTSIVSARLGNVILQHVATHLSRSTVSLSRLTKADVDFLLPITRGPRVTRFLPMSTPCGSLASLSPKYLMFLRQSMMQFTTLLGGIDVVQALSQHLQIRYDVHSDVFPTPPMLTPAPTSTSTAVTPTSTATTTFTPGSPLMGQALPVSAMATNTDVIGPGELAFLYCSVSSRNLTPAEVSIGQGVACVCVYLARDGQVLFRPPSDAASTAGLQWMVELWTHGSIQVDALMDHVRLAHEQAVLDVMIDDAVLSGQWERIATELAATGTECHHPCLHYREFPTRLARWKIESLFEHVRKSAPAGFAPFVVQDQSQHRQAVSRIVASVTPSTPSDDRGFYSAHTHCFKADKVTRVSVVRQTLLLVQVMQGSIKVIGWDVKAATFSTFAAKVLEYLDQYAQHVQRVNTITMAKLGFADREVQSFPVLQTVCTRGLADSAGVCRSKLGVGRAMPAAIGDVVVIADSVPTSPARGSFRPSPVPGKEPNSSNKVVDDNDDERPDSLDARLSIPEQHVLAYEAFLAAYNRSRERGESLCLLYERWRQRHQRNVSQGSSASFAPTLSPSAPTSAPAKLSSTTALAPNPKPSPSAPATSTVSDSDLKSVLRFARLIHWCRTPVLFHCRVLDQFSFQPNATSRPEEARTFFAQLIPEMLQYYCQYLSTLGLVLISQQHEKDEFVVAPNVTVPTDRVYLQKSFQGGVLLVEVAVKQVFLAVNLFTVNRRYGPHQQRLPSPGFNLPDYSRQSFRLFTEECSKFKNLIHVNSFLFDYHVRKMRLLILDSVNTVFAVIDILRALLHHFPPAGYSKCRLFHGTVAEPNSQLVSYLFSHPVRFKLGLMAQSNAFFISWTGADVALVAPVSNAANSNEYVAVLRQVPAGIEYYCLETPPAPAPPPAVVARSHSTASAASVAHHYFPHVQADAQSMIRSLLTRAEVDHARDQKWRSLLDDDHRGDTRTWLATAREFFCVSLVALDPAVHTLLSVPGDWNAIALTLESEWPYGVRQLTSDASGPPLLMFLNPNDTAMYLLSLHPPHVNVVIRDEREHAVGAIVELFVRALCQSIWRCLHGALS